MALDAICSGMRDPVAKLRFIRESLHHYGAMRKRVGWVPSASLRRALYVWLAIERFRPLVDRGKLLPAARARLRRSLIVGRTLAAGALLGTAGLAGVLAYGVFVAIPGTFARTTRPAPAAISLPEPPPVAAAPEPSPPAAPTPSSIWLVETGPGWEQYSNGVRIDTSHAVRGERRRFHVFDAEGMGPEVYEAPVGILFHTSESDIWPLEESFNQNLRDSSQRLLRYLGRNTVYNYLVDRFGRVYRVVEDDCKANHAGYSVWAHGGRYYLSLNNAFLGVCFETRWEGGVALPITDAQFSAGRQLTDCLRQRFGIAPEMCVAHGLTSVNAKKHLIGHHVDWARGFPFAAFGLPDQYRRPSPAVEAFGFSYDEDFLAVMGEPWPGVRAAELTLSAEAARRELSIDEIRRERQALYDKWIQEQARDEASVASGRAEKARARGPQGG